MRRSKLYTTGLAYRHGRPMAVLLKIEKGNIDGSLPFSRFHLPYAILSNDSAYLSSASLPLILIY